MNALFRWVALRPLRAHPGRTLLTILGVALGVGVFTSIRLASRTALDSFSDSVDAVTGRAQLVVRGDAEGFDERAFLAARSAAEVAAAAPVVEVEAPAAPRGGSDETAYDEPMVVLGVDPLLEAPFVRLDAGGDEGSGALSFLADPSAVAVTRAFADRHGLVTGDTLRFLASGRPAALVVRRVLEARELQQAWGGNVAVVDIATAQDVFGRIGRIDRVDVIAERGALDRARAALERALPAGLRVERPAARTRQVENMVRAFDLNLTALSFIALFVASFLVFDAVSGAVLRRRREAAILRALGMTRRSLAGLFVAEGLFYGVAGSAAGLALGVALARVTVGAVGRTLQDLYHVRGSGLLVPEPGVLAGGFALGVALSLLAALVPAREAAAASPALAAREGARPPLARRTLALASWSGAALLALGAAAAWTASAGHRPYDGFASAFLVLAGFAALVPLATLGLERALRAPLRRLAGAEGFLASRSLEDSVGRTAPVVAALMVAVAMVVAMAVMVGSFRRTVDVWVRQSIRGDLYVEPVGHRLNASATRLPAWLPDTLARLPGVVAVDSYRGTVVVVGDRPAMVAGVDLAVQRDHGRLLFMHGESAEVVERARASGGALVTESFAHHHRAREGDTLALATPSGAARLRVEGVLYDYSTDAGVVFLDRALYARLWRDDRTESVALYLAPGVDPARARSEVSRAAGGRVLLHVTPNHELRERVLKVFDRTFRVTWALELIAVLVAVLGVFHSLTALVLERSAEIAMLRAAGALRAQVRRMVLAESALLGVVAAALGGLCGVALSLLLIHVINRQFFGWTIRTAWDAGLFVRTSALVVASALAAGWLPARLAAAREPAESLREE